MDNMVPLPTTEAYVEGYSRATIANTLYSLAHLLRYHLASMVLLVEQNLLDRSRARQIIAVLFELRELGVEKLPLDPALENIQPNLERFVIGRLGADVGGDLSIGRARHEFGFVAEYMALREEMLDTLSCVVGLDDALREVGRSTLDALAPYYTSHMRAEPITFGYYFASVNEGIQQDERRLRDAYHRMDRSPAGIGHVVSSPLGFDRTRLAELLGFSAKVQTSLYANHNVDVAVDALNAMALAAATVGRFGLDLYQWGSSDLALIRFGDAFCGSSFVMPQKRNPSFLKAVQRSLLEVKTKQGQAMELFLHTAPMRLVGLEQIPRLQHLAGQDLRFALKLMADAVRSITVDRERGRKVSGADFTQSAQLVHLLVDGHDVSWRSAEQIIGRLVREALAGGQSAADLKPERLAAIAGEVVGREVVIDPASFRRALDVEAIVRSRGDSGPAPEAVERVLAAQHDIARAEAAFISGQRKRLSETWERLDAAARAI